MTQIFPLLHAALTAHMPQITDPTDRKAAIKYLRDIEVLLNSIPKPSQPSNVITFKPRAKAPKKRTMKEDLIAILECKSDGFGGFEYADID